jgi:hypothetical protein
VKHSLSILSFVVGLWIGVSLADFDHTLAFLRHRSIVTHGAIIPLVIYLLAPKNQDWVRMGLVGLFIGMAAHLSYDLFPNGWGTFARINVPFYGYLSPTLSIIWISLNVVASLYIALLIVQKGHEVGIAAVGLVVAFMGCAPNENAFWSPLIGLVVALGLALVLPGSAADASRLIQRRLKTS